MIKIEYEFHYHWTIIRRFFADHDYFYKILIDRHVSYRRNIIDIREHIARKVRR